MRLDAYVRVSRVQGREGDSFHSPAEQRERIAAWAAAHGHELAQLHEDLDQSGGTIDRPGFQAALCRIESGETDGLVVARLDRFARSISGAWAAIDRIQTAGGTFVSVADSFDLTTAAGRLMFNVLSSFAAFERDRIVEQWDATTARVIGRGVHIANAAPFGYRKGSDGRLERDPQTAPLVVEAFTRRAGGESWRQLSDWLNSRAVTATGAQWSPRTAAHIVKRETYLGVAFRGEHRCEDAHPALVTLPEWRAANAVQGGPGGIRRGDSALLAGLIRCAGCRYSVKADRAKTRPGEPQRRQYRCSGHHAGGACPSPATIDAPKLERHVLMWLLWWHGEDKIGQPNGDALALREARRASDDAHARLEAFLADDELRGIVGRDAYLKSARDRERAVEQARATVERMEAEHGQDDARPRVLSEAWWDDLDREEQRATLHRCIGTIFVRPGREPVSERAVIFAPGELPAGLPRRGVKGYVPTPLEWPEDPALASVPGWAWRQFGREAAPPRGHVATLPTVTTPLDVSL